MSLGASFVAALSATPSVSAFFGYGAIDHLFKGNEVELWGFVKRVREEVRRSADSSRRSRCTPARRLSAADGAGWCTTST